MPGTGGFRKVRVGRDGIGKLGGARVIYILRNAGFPIFPITAYKERKRQPDQSRTQALAKRADEIFSEYGGTK